MINLVVYIVSTLTTYILGLISKRYNWTIPIPIQNILIGIICFIGVIIGNLICKKPIDVEIIIPAIISALGGAGTAALCYDTKKSIKEE